MPKPQTFAKIFSVWKGEVDALGGSTSVSPHPAEGSLLGANRYTFASLANAVVLNCLHAKIRGTMDYAAAKSSDYCFIAHLTRGRHASCGRNGWACGGTG